MYFGVVGELLTQFCDQRQFLLRKFRRGNSFGHCFIIYPRFTFRESADKLEDEPRFGYSWNLLSARLIVEYLKKKRSREPSGIDNYLVKEIDAITNLADVRRHAQHFRMDPVDMLDNL